jgi:hypothetical protein
MVQHKTIVAFDGEGYLDRYVLLASSDDERWNKRGLSARECLEFLTKPCYAKTLNVWYSFGYDVNMFLKNYGSIDFWQGRQTIQLGDYRIRYFPRKILKITRKRVTYTHYDLFGFFQTSFRTALKKWLGVTDEIIERGKAARGNFERWTRRDVIEYNRRELKYLEQLAEKVIEAFSTLDIPLEIKSWHGAGAAAQAALRHIKLEEELETDPRLPEYARAAYYGGRVETNQRGTFRQTIYNYDIKSAYPAAGLEVPRLSETVWQWTHTYRPNRLGIYHVEFEAKPDDTLGPLPVRVNSGLITFPLRGRGVYWSPEIRAALKAGVNIKVLDGLINTHTQPSRLKELIEQLYALRQKYLDAGDGREKAVKLTLNALYGKLAQKAGGRYHSLALAGLMTSITRAKIFEACYPQQTEIIAIATDGIYSRAALDVRLGNHLGEWEVTEGHLKLVMSGVYAFAHAGGSEVKTRGFTLPPDKFDDLYRQLCRGKPAILHSKKFVTNSLALLQPQAHPHAATWTIETREINPQHDVKRCWPGRFTGAIQYSAPLWGGWESLPYTPKPDYEVEPEYIDFDEI